MGWNQRLPEIAAAVALAELERIEELAEMRTLSAMAFDAVVQDCDWIRPQHTPQGYINAYWNYACVLERDDVNWAAMLAKFIELGGDGYYGGSSGILHAGGGGGSGYLHPTDVTSGSLQTATDSTTPPNTGDVDYPGSIGTTGAAAAGGAGHVVVLF